MEKISEVPEIYAAIAGEVHSTILFFTNAAGLWYGWEVVRFIEEIHVIKRALWGRYRHLPLLSSAAENATRSTAPSNQLKCYGVWYTHSFFFTSSFDTRFEIRIEFQIVRIAKKFLPMKKMRLKCRYWWSTPFDLDNICGYLRKIIEQYELTKHRSEGQKMAARKSALGANSYDSQFIRDN